MERRDFIKGVFASIPLLSVPSVLEADGIEEDQVEGITYQEPNLDTLPDQETFERGLRNEGWQYIKDEWLQGVDIGLHDERALYRYRWSFYPPESINGIGQTFHRAADTAELDLIGRNDIDEMRKDDIRLQKKKIKQDVYEYYIEGKYHETS